MATVPPFGNVSISFAFRLLVTQQSTQLAHPVDGRWIDDIFLPPAEVFQIEFIIQHPFLEMLCQTRNPWRSHKIRPEDRTNNRIRRKPLAHYRVPLVDTISPWCNPDTRNFRNSNRIDNFDQENDRIQLRLLGNGDCRCHRNRKYPPEWKVRDCGPKIHVGCRFYNWTTNQATVLFFSFRSIENGTVGVSSTAGPFNLGKSKQDGDGSMHLIRP